ncbi:hypothetical protein B0H13DRAFT_1911260 [Mycena leptocephala]|nr:hypothetical protein B0H13DRAFT_1911260 [Mycena leptocephala]
MARPSKRTQKLRKNAQKATQSRKARVEDSDSDSDGDSGPAAVPITSHPTSLSHDENSRCQHDHHCPPPDFDAGETWDFDLGNDLPDLDCDEWLSGEDELDDEVVEAPEISEETELKTFATLLNDAQEAARVREREREKASRRPKHYNKTSKSTKYRNRKPYSVPSLDSFPSTHIPVASPGDEAPVMVIHKPRFRSRTAQSTPENEVTLQEGRGVKEDDT